METLSKNKIAYLRKFLKKKIRREFRKCLVEGEKLCIEALDNGYEFEILLYVVGKGRSYNRIIEHPGVKQVCRTTDKIAGSLSEVETPQGILGLVHLPPPGISPGSGEHSRYLALDSIADPGNMGTILRTASWYGIDGVICSEKCAEILNGKVIRSSMGAVFHLNVWENMRLCDTLDSLKKKGFRIIGSVPRDGKENMEVSGKSVIVVGSEARGLSNDILNLCDDKFSIKGIGKAESINAAVSAGIMMDRFFNR